MAANPSARAKKSARKEKKASAPGKPKSAHRRYVSQGKNLNKDSRRELRQKH